MAQYYAIVDANTFSQALIDGEINASLLFDNILEDNFSTLRYSLDQSQFVIKTDSELSKEYLRIRASELGVIYNEYSYDEILVIMSSNTWSLPDPCIIH